MLASSRCGWPSRWSSGRDQVGRAEQVEEFVPGQPALPVNHLVFHERDVARLVLRKRSPRGEETAWPARRAGSPCQAFATHANRWMFNHEPESLWRIVHLPAS